MLTEQLRKIRTLSRLGPSSILRVGFYRIGKATRTSRALRIVHKTPSGPYFDQVNFEPSGREISRRWRLCATYFGRHEFVIDDLPPHWHENPFSGHSVPHPERQWWRIPDFDPTVGDIKVIWEASRFEWVIRLAQLGKEGNLDAVVRLNSWIEDWCQKNQPYRGPNWKCGQEASIRVLHLAAAGLLLGQVSGIKAGLIDLLQAHLKRIATTISYAIGQNNNHGTSEAAALLVGGSWLAANGVRAGEGWAALGRGRLIERVGYLVEQDGTFSQYSVNYQRLLIDTLSFVEVWRRALGLEQFPGGFRMRAAAAVNWLRIMVDCETGYAPNLGHNDGGQLIPLANTDFRDHRPSVQLASVLYAAERAYLDAETADEPLSWFGIELPSAVAAKPKSRIFKDGGYAILRRDSQMLLLRYPRAKFRPSHADALHVDFWHKGVNVLTDGGSYSYNAAEKWQTYFPGTSCHNTIEFDGMDQMPRLSRFLFAEWLETEWCTELVENDDFSEFGASYRDYRGNRHKRTVRLMAKSLVVSDEVEMSGASAILRWRLMPGTWRQSGDEVFNGVFNLAVSGNVNIVRLEITRGWESHYYMERTELPVLEVEFRGSGKLESTLRWN